jgi:hypothetical protein
MKACPVIRRMTVAEAALEPPDAPAMTGGIFPEGGGGQGKVYERTSVRVMPTCLSECDCLFFR